MPLNIQRLATAINSALDALYPIDPRVSGNAMADFRKTRMAFCTAIAQAVITEITVNATVTVTGVQTGTGTAPGVIL